MCLNFYFMVNGDLVGDMITRIRNASAIKSPTVKVLRTNLTSNIAQILKNEGFIESFEDSGEVFLKQDGFVHKYISITLKYKGVKQKPYITGLKLISKPGLRVYVGQNNIPKVLGGIGVAILSTSKGLVTDRVARMTNLGGEILFYVW